MTSFKPIGADAKQPILLLPAPTTPPADKKQPSIVDGGCIPPPIRPPIQPQPPQYSQLDDAQIALISGKGGAGISGHGTLEGTIGFEQVGLIIPRPVLKTADGVFFNLNTDLTKVQPLVGQSVRIEGNIDKITDTTGRISAVQIKQEQPISDGAFVTLKGDIATLQSSFTPGAPPSGPYLVLAQPIQIDGQDVSRLFLGYREVTGSTQNREFFGQIKKADNGRYVQLAGASDVAAGEPRFNGRDFVTADGKPAARLILDQQSIVDGPDIVLVLDQGADKAFEGQFSSFMRGNPGPSFGGFSGKTYTIESANQADRAAIQQDVTRGVTTKDGRKLPTMFSQSEGGANPRGTTWAYDKENDTAYGITTQGGFAGFNGTVSQVIRNLSETRFGPGGV